MPIKSLTSKAIAAALAGALILPMATVAEAGGGHRHNNNAGAAVAAGVIGLAAGAILGSALSQPQYVDPPARVYAPPRPVYREPVYVERRYYREPVVVEYAPRPWTREWYNYCSARYRSFDPGSGTYITYSGEERFCQ